MQIWGRREVTPLRSDISILARILAGVVRTHTSQIARLSVCRRPYLGLNLETGCGRPYGLFDFDSVL